MLSKTLRKYLGAPLKILAGKDAASVRSRFILVVSVVAAIVLVVSSLLPVKASGDSSPPGNDPTPTVANASTTNDDTDGSEKSSVDNVAVDGEQAGDGTKVVNDDGVSEDVSSGSSPESSPETDGSNEAANTESPESAGSPESSQSSGTSDAESTETNVPSDAQEQEEPAQKSEDEEAALDETSDDEISTKEDTEQEDSEVVGFASGDGYNWATGTTRTITVTAAGDRDGATDTIKGLNGAVYVAVQSSSSTPPALPTTLDNALYCTTGGVQDGFTREDGVCRIKVAPGWFWDRLPYWILEYSVADPFSKVDNLALGTQDSIGQYRYAFRISGGDGNVSTPLSTQATHISDSRYRTVSGKWSHVRNNPAFPGMCLTDDPLKVALIIDQSGSVDETEIEKMKDAAKSFASSRGLGSTNTYMGLYGFNETAYQALPATSIADAAGIATVTDAIDKFQAVKDVATNWDHALRLVGTEWDAVIMLTDGNPTRYLSDASAGIGSATDLRAIEEAIASANYLKSEGTSVLTVGIGMPEASRVNLNAISSVADTYDATNFEDLDDVLHTIAQRSQCSASIRVQKSVTDTDGNNPSTIAGWPMKVQKTADNANGDVELCEITAGGRNCSTGSAVSTLPTIGASHMAQWALQFTTPEGQNASVKIDEGMLMTPSEYAGYEFVKYTYTIKHADGTTSDPVEVTAPAATDFMVEDIESGDEVMVVYTNKPLPEPDVANVSWQKKNDSGESLGGTTWTLKRTAPTTETITIEDNLGQDKDDRDGHFLVMDLQLGDYTLTEESAPDGYVFDSTPHPFTLTASGFSFDVAFVNTAKRGTVTWKKVEKSADGSTTPLAGSTWTITPVAPKGDEIIVEDYTGQEMYEGKDTDSAAGSFKVEGLAWGEYELVETEAPFGYVLDSAKYPFTISATALDFQFDTAFVNTRPDIPSLPLTGGSSSDAYWIAGGLTVILTLIVGFGVHLYRTQRRTHATSGLSTTDTGE
ncbi:MAG: VWA domain-containing protein [Bifidobacteriaceae bacterium]|jgi:hypothetical protein|nr:VWA domain-containing protein [Bifidobacteriaceae bacterium]